MKQPTVYLDTTIISAYWYGGRDVASLARKLKTREWWNTERRHFSLWTSSVSEIELRAGAFRRQVECVRMVQRLNYLPITSEASELVDQILEIGIVPANKPRDALQMAVSAAHEMDYLLSWNYAHLANPVVQSRLDALCRQRDLRAPLLVSPETIPKVALGQIIRRRKP